MTRQLLPDRWQTLAPLFDAALERAPDQRRAFADDVCSGDVDLRARLEALLADCERSDALLEGGAVEGFASLLDDTPVQLPALIGGRYRVEQRIGAGGMATVHLARDLKHERNVALKVLNPEVGALLGVERFLAEIRVTANLHHPNLLPLFDSGEAKASPDGPTLLYYVMPFVDGETLRARLTRDKQLSVDETVRIAVGILSALDYAHAQRVIHRDIKPENILLQAGQPVLADFGIALAVANAGGDRVTQTGISLGTPQYMSPEQVLGDRALDARTDIYSLGCVLYELLAGEPPQSGPTAEVAQAKLLGEKPRPIDELRDDVPPHVAAAIDRALARLPADRFTRASDFAAALVGATGPERPGGRRMLARALAVYALAFVAAALFAKAAITGIGLPDWVFPGTLVVMALGLPAILFTAYTEYVTRRAPSGAKHGAVASLGLKAGPYVSWRRATFGGVYALGAFIVGIGLYMFLRAFGIGPAGSLLGAGKITAQERVLIADFAVSNADTALGPVMNEAVRAVLAPSKVIDLVNPDRVAAALRRMRHAPTTPLHLAVARELAQREGIKAIVDGKVTGVSGGGYILSVRLVRADSGGELAAFHEAANGPRGLIEAADNAGRDLRAKIGESLRAVHATPGLERRTTSSLEALKKYTAGLRANTTGQFRESVALLREAVGIDSTFASAWRVLSSAMMNAGLPQSARDSAADNAYRYSARLPEAEQRNLRATYYYTGRHRDRTKAIAAYHEIVERDYAGAANNLAILYAHRAQYAIAESLLTRTIRLVPGFSLPYWNATMTQLSQGKIREAEATLTLALSRFPENPVLRNGAPLLWYAKGDIGRAEREVDSLYSSRNRDVRLYGIRLKAQFARLHGRYTDSKRWIRERDSVFVTQGGSRIVLADSVNALNTDAWFHGPSERLVRALDATLSAISPQQIAPVDRPYFVAAEAYARAGRPDKARAILRQYQLEVTDTALLRVQQPYWHVALGEIALAERKGLSAADEFRRGDIDPSDSSHATFPTLPSTALGGGACGVVCLSFNLGRAFDVAGMPDSAIAMFERYVTTRYAFRLIDLDHLALAGVHKRLGELYDAKRDRQNAVLHYTKYVELWKNADSEFQPRVDTVRRRISMLTGVDKR